MHTGLPNMLPSMSVNDGIPQSSNHIQFVAAADINNLLQQQSKLHLEVLSALQQHRPCFATTNSEGRHPKQEEAESCSSSATLENISPKTNMFVSISGLCCIED